MDLVSEVVTDDWQSNRETIRERNKYMFQNSLMSDVTFVVMDSSSEGKTLLIPTHKYVLAVSSPVFFAMFYGEMAEVGDRIELPDCESESFLEFLRYLYCDELNVSARNVLGVMYLAQKYIVPSLTRKCGLFLEERIEPGNVFDTLTQAKRFGESKLESRCWFIVDLNAKQCLQSRSFLELDQQSVLELLKREELKVDECFLFEAVVRWATEKCKAGDLEVSGANMRRHIADAITSIRFPAMSQGQFAENVVPREILSDRESLNIFLYFSTKTKKTKLPFLCQPRKGRQLQRCCRSPDPPTPLHWYRPPNSGNAFGNVGRREENVSFVLLTSTLVYIAGVRLFTHTSLNETKPDCIKYVILVISFFTC